MSAPARSIRRISATLVALLALVVALVPNRGLVASAASEVHRLSIGALAVLAGAVFVHRLTQSAMLAVITGRLRMGQAITVNEAHTGCSLALVGGGAVGTGVKVAMLSSWGVENGTIAASITATSVIPIITQWAMTALAAAILLAQGDHSIVNQLALTGGIVLSVGPLLGWRALLDRPRAVARIASTVAPGSRWLARRRVLPSRLRTWCAELDLVRGAESMRVAAQPLRGRRGAIAFALAALANLLVGLILVATLHGLDITAQHRLYPVEAMAALALARTLGSFAPLPGGIGLLDAGLLASLTGHGVDAPSALAALALYRAATFVVPILTGAVSIMLWRRARGATGHAFTSQA